MATTTADNGRTGVDERLAKALGWVSAGLGVPQVLAPQRMARLIGVSDSPAGRAVMRAVGVRELTAATGILRRERPAGWLWARVAGDALDLTLLGLGAAANPKARKRAAAAAAAVVGVTVLDTVTGARLSTSRTGSAVRASAAVTVNRPVHEVFAFWRQFDNFPNFMAHVESVEQTEDGRWHWTATGPTGTVEWDAEVTAEVPDERIAWESTPDAQIPNRGWVEFAEAPGGRGTEVRVELEYEPPAGAVGAMAARLLGEEPGQQLKDDLRRFKQVMEAGEVVRSNGSPEGTLTRRLMHQEEARP